MLSLVDVTVRFGEQAAVHGVTLDVRDGEQLSLLGPSGSGKSTLLRAIAGLEPLAQGRIEWNGRDVTRVPVHRRGFGLMFQDYVLFPHLDVAANVGFGLDGTDVAADERGRIVAESLDLVGLRGFERRLPTQLSGGEQQRVALARALAPRPQLLMFDEPLGALDRSLRRTLLDELIEIFARLDTPIIYVTHDHEEALAVGDRVAVMRDGRLETVMAPTDLWERPPNEFVARFLGLTNILDARVTDGRAATEIGEFALPSQAAGADGDRHKLLVRPAAFRPSTRGPLSGTVHATTFRGDHTLLVVDFDGREGASRRLEVEWSTSPVPRAGERITLATDPAGLVVLPLP